VPSLYKSTVSVGFVQLRFLGIARLVLDLTSGISTVASL
jgi:hypothetical protein